MCIDNCILCLQHCFAGQRVNNRLEADPAAEAGRSSGRLPAAGAPAGRRVEPQLGWQAQSAVCKMSAASGGSSAQHAAGGGRRRSGSSSQHISGRAHSSSTHSSASCTCQQRLGLQLSVGSRRQANMAPTAQCTFGQRSQHLQLPFWQRSWDCSSSSRSPSTSFAMGAVRQQAGQ